MKDLQCEGKVKILRVGFSNPMPEAVVKGFLKGCEKVLVVEEGEPFMEEAIKAFAQEEGITISIKGKGPGQFSRLYEFDPAMVRKVLADYVNVAYEPAGIVDVSDVPEIPQRPPNLCAGCSHRATFYIAKQAAAGMETIYPTDIGCYTLGVLPPLSTADFLICMGSSVTTSCGFSKATKKKVISFIGDSTFFHSGIPGLINAVFNNHNFTLFILDNGTTAMTGHQPNPGVEMERLGLSGYGRIAIEDATIQEGSRTTSANSEEKEMGGRKSMILVSVTLHASTLAASLTIYQLHQPHLRIQLSPKNNPLNKMLLHLTAQRRRLQTDKATSSSEADSTITELLRKYKK